jgi:hypothetical protein
MSSVADPHPEPPVHEELVAYLDGELSPEECRRVEARLSADAEYRRQFRDLDQAWEALNTLPASRVDDGFARTTIELATVAAQGELSQRTAHVATETRRYYWSWAAAGLAAIMASFVAGRLLLPNRNERLLADLPVILHADTLSLVDSPEFLRQLAAKVPADQMTSDESKLDVDLAALKSIASPSLDTRRKWIENRTLEQKAELAAQAKHFEQDFRRPEQERMRGLASTLGHSQPDDSMQKTLLVYQQWLSELKSSDIEQLRDDLQDLSPAEQADRVARAVRRQREQASRHLTADERSDLRAAILSLVQENIPEYMRGMQQRRDGDRGRPTERLPYLILQSQLWNPETREATRERLVNVLSPDSQDHWRRLRRRSQEAQAQQLWQWIREAFKPNWGPKELEDFFAGQDISNADRERLLNLPSAEMRTELEKMYLNHEWRGFAEALREPGVRPGGPRGGFRPDGPPPERPPRHGGPPEEFENRRFRPGPDERRGPPPDNLRERREPGGPPPRSGVEDDPAR